MLDHTKAAKRQANINKGLNPDDLSEDARADIEAAEDEFVGQTEEAVGVMKNVSNCSIASESVRPRLVNHTQAHTKFLTTLHGSFANVLRLGS